MPPSLPNQISSSTCWESARPLPDMWVVAASDSKKNVIAHSNEIVERLEHFSENDFVYDVLRQGSSVPVVGNEYNNLIRFTVDTCVDYAAQTDQELPSHKVFEFFADHMESERLYLSESATAVVPIGEHADLVGRRVYYGVQLDQDAGWVLRPSELAAEKVSRWSRHTPEVSYLQNNLTVGRGYDDGQGRRVRIAGAAIIRPTAYANSTAREKLKMPLDDLSGTGPFRF